MRVVHYELSMKRHLGVRVPGGIVPVERLLSGLPDNLPSLLALESALERIRLALENAGAVEVVP